MLTINFIDTGNGKVSVQANCPKINGIVQPMELNIVIVDENEKYTIYCFNKEQCKELMEQMNEAIGLVECFG